MTETGRTPPDETDSTFVVVEISLSDPERSVSILQSGHLQSPATGEAMSTNDEVTSLCDVLKRRRISRSRRPSLDVRERVF